MLTERAMETLITVFGNDEYLFSDKARLLMLIVACALLWSLESFIPLKQFARERVRRALPNIGLTAGLVLTNLLLGFASAQVITLIQEKQFGLFFIVKLSWWMVVIVGVMALDLFAYLAHVLLHKSWLGWQVHRGHHFGADVDVPST